jgi:hypothetical protein
MMRNLRCTIAIWFEYRKNKTHAGVAINLRLTIKNIAAAVRI